MKQVKQTVFGFEFELLGEPHEVVWHDRTQLMEIRGVEAAKARLLLAQLTELDQLVALREWAVEQKRQTDPCQAPQDVVRPAPYAGAEAASPPSPGPAPTPGPRVTLPVADRKSPEPTPPKVQAVQKPVTPTPPPHEERGVDVDPKPPTEASPPWGPDLSNQAVELGAQIPDSARRTLEEKAKSLAETAEKLTRPGRDPNEVLAYYKSQPQGQKGNLDRREARSQVHYRPGDDYQGQKVLTAEMADTVHGEVWSVVLDSGDCVLIGLQGQVIEYVPVEPDGVVPGVTDVDPGVPSAPAPAGSLPEPPEEVLESRKINRLMQWVIENDSTHAGGVDTNRLVEQMWGFQDRSKALAAAKTKEKVERRVLSALNLLGIAVKG